MHARARPPYAPVVSHFYIHCPNCGRRPCSEFGYHGEVRPLEDPHASEADEIARLWLRRNACGPQRERWFHAAGCRRLVTVTRDTRTNIILAQPGEEAGDASVYT
jgi:methylglutamate dehydrogenase subunit B